MAAIPDDRDAAPCPVRAGDRFRTLAGTRLTVLAIDDHDRARLARERNGRSSRLRMPVADVRRRVRRGAWVHIPR